MCVKYLKFISDGFAGTCDPKIETKIFFRQFHLISLNFIFIV